MYVRTFEREFNLPGHLDSSGEYSVSQGWFAYYDRGRNQVNASISHFAEAFGKDIDFFTFYRSMQAYEAGMRHADTRMVLSPDSEFFRYFVDPSGRPRDNSARQQGNTGTPTPAAPATPR